LFDQATTPEVRTFASLLQPIGERESMEIGGTKLVGRQAIEMEKLRKQAILEGKAEGEALGFAEGFEKGVLAGREQGYQDGYKQAYDETAAKLTDQLHSALARMVRKINQAMAKWYERSEPQLAKLSVLIAARIVAKEISLSPDTVLAITKQAVSEITHAESARIRVNPFEAAILREHRQVILAASTSLREVEIVEDASLISGCMVESDGGVVDARLNEKLNEVLQSIGRAA